MMTDDILPLDGNAAAGRLSQVFSFDVTRAIVVCGSCGNRGPFAALRLYGGDAGTILRCRRCDAVNLRFLETERTLNLDLSGAARITIDIKD